MKCRSHATRERLVKEYDIRPIAHLRLICGQNKQSDAGPTLSDQYYVFGVYSKDGGGDAIDTIQCGLSTARDFLSLTGKEPLPLFSPIVPTKGETPVTFPRIEGKEARQQPDRSEEYIIRDKGREIDNAASSPWSDITPKFERLPPRTRNWTPAEYEARFREIEAHNARFRAMQEANEELGEENKTKPSQKATGDRRIIVWHPAAKQLYNAILMIIVCWDVQNYTGALFALLEEATKYYYCAPYFERVRHVNSIIKKDYYHRTLTEMIKDVSALEKIRPYQFDLLADILAEKGEESFF